MEISEVNRNDHLGDWRCEVWNAYIMQAGGMAEEDATIRVVELGVRYQGPLSNLQDNSVIVDSGTLAMLV